MMKTPLLFVSLLAIGLWTRSDGLIMPSLCVSMPNCNLPMEAGLCKAYKPRYHYDPSTNTCKRFIYGGCGGNANNFKTKAACEKHCKKPCPIRCKAGYVCMWQQIVCKKAPCPPGRFTCVAICNLPKETGPCRGSIPRYHYDPSTNTCKQFIYGGCGGNANNFRTKAACEKHCKKPCPLRCAAGYVCKWQQIMCIRAPCPPGRFTCVAICGMPKVIGPCEAHVPRYHYDTKTRSCLLFYYGGCGGNENNFKTKADCERTCKP